MTPMLSTNFKTIVQPILNEPFDGIYNQRPEDWKGFGKQRKGIDRQYHEEPVMYGLPAAPEKPPGTPVNYAGGGVLYNKRYYFRTYGIAFAMTKELISDGDHARLGTVFAESSAQAMIETKETLMANLLNRAFNSTYTGGDGVSLVSTAHLVFTGTQSNQLTTAAALSMTSAEQMLIQIMNAADNTGKRISLSGKKLIVSPNNAFQAQRILKSVLDPSNANNAVNAIMASDLLTQGVTVVRRMTSTTAWFIKTDVLKGITLMMRQPLEKRMEGDFETNSMRWAVEERYDTGWTDWRDIWGTAGL